MPGPPPAHPDQRRRRNLAPAQTRLPADGREGDLPAWPIGRATKAEAAAWADVWATPQSAAWERLGWVRSVARYVRMLVQSERPKAPASLCAEVRQMEDRLGLTPMSMMRLHWEIAPDELVEARQATTPKERLRLVDPGAVARPG